MVTENLENYRVPFHHLLTTEEEISLAKTIERGKNASEYLPFLAQIYPELASDAESQLQDLLEDAKNATNLFVESNLRLVPNIAIKYRGRELPIDDLIQIGYLSLFDAVENFDHRLGFKFSTYASRCIEMNLLREITNQARIIRIPVRRSEDLTESIKNYEKLCQDLGREPTTYEVAKEGNVNHDRLKLIIRAANGCTPLSFLVGEDDSDELANFIPSTLPSPDEETLTNFLQEDVRQILEILDDREKVICSLRFVNGMTQEEVGKELGGLSRQRVSQIEKGALAKLKPEAIKNNLDSYLKS